MKLIRESPRCGCTVLENRTEPTLVVVSFNSPPQKPTDSLERVYLTAEHSLTATYSVNDMHGVPRRTAHLLGSKT